MACDGKSGGPCGGRLDSLSQPLSLLRQGRFWQRRIFVFFADFFLSVFRAKCEREVVGKWRRRIFVVCDFAPFGDFTPVDFL
jgi:hypothetical protein